MTAGAADIFVLVASACMVALTLAALAVGYVLLRAGLELWAVVRMARSAAQRAADAQAHLNRRARYATKLVRILSRRIIGGW